MKPMRLISFFTVVAFTAILSSCVTPPSQGDTEAEVVAKLGQPTHRYKLEQGHLLEYKTGPWGQHTYMARIDSAGRMVTYEQVLSQEKFSTLKAGQANKNDVLRTIGAPSETSYLPRTDLEVWSYPYKESGAWDSVMHIHFDRAGVVQKMLNAPDPRRDPDTRFPFRMMMR